MRGYLTRKRMNPILASKKAKKGMAALDNKQPLKENLGVVQ
jgi:hypothetical protein